MKWWDTCFLPTLLKIKIGDISKVWNVAWHSFNRRSRASSPILQSLLFLHDESQRKNFESNIAWGIHELHQTFWFEQFLNGKLCCVTIVGMFVLFCYLEWMIYGGKLIWCDVRVEKKELFCSKRCHTFSREKSERNTMWSIHFNQQTLAVSIFEYS